MKWILDLLAALMQLAFWLCLLGLACLGFFGIGWALGIVRAQ